MVVYLHQWFSSVRKRAIAKLAIVMGLILLIGLSTVQNYGISSDESTEVRMVQANIDLITKNQPIRNDWQYYGTLFNFLSEGIFRVEDYVRYGRLEHPLDCPANTTCEQDALRERIRVKHVVTFLFSLLGYGAVAGVVAIFWGWQSSWIAPIVLALVPGYWAHSFFNPKDSPFAAFFILCTWLGAYVVEQFLHPSHPLKLGNNRLTRLAIAYGALIGLLTAIRIGGFLMLGFIGIAYLILMVKPLMLGKEKEFIPSILRVVPFYAVICASWMGVVVALHPASWSNPPLWLYRSIRYLSRHSWDKYVLFNGEYVLAADAPWSYIPTWLGITTPAIILLLFALGLVWMLRQFPRLSTLQQSCSILLLLQVFLLPFIAIVRGSTVYDGIRQFLFVLPAMTAIAALAVIALHQRLGDRYPKLFFTVLMGVLLSPIVYDMVVLHPYEYMYFNRVSGGLPAAYTRFETDYWGLSVKEAVGWLNTHAEPGARLGVSVPFNTTLLSADPDITVVDMDYNYKEFTLDDSQPPMAPPFYYLAIPKHKLHDVFQECEVVHQVERQGVPLTIIRYCQ